MFPYFWVVHTHTHTYTAHKKIPQAKTFMPIKTSHLDGFLSRCQMSALSRKTLQSSAPVCRLSCFSSEPPSAPQQLISVVNETSVVLEWAPPRRLGGRSDTSYGLECLICQTGGDNVGRAPPHNRSGSQPEAPRASPGTQSDQGIMRARVQGEDEPRPGPDSGLRSQLCLPCGPGVVFSPGQTGLKTTKVVVSELKAHTSYTFIVHARNGVSQASGSGVSQSVSVTITTNQAGETFHPSSQ